MPIQRLRVLRVPLVILLLWLAGLGAAAQFAKIAVPFSMIRDQYPEAGAHIGWLLTLISALGAALGMTAGILVARFGCRRVLILSIALGGGVSLWQAGLPGFAPMLASRLIEGMPHLAIVVAAPTLIAEISPDRVRGMAMTLWSTFFSVGFALMAWLGGPFALAHGLGALFAAHGTVMLVLAMVLAVALPRANGDPSARPHRPGEVLRQHIRAYGSPWISAPAFGWLFYTLTFVSLLAILPGLVPEDSRATVMSLMPVANIAVSLVLAAILLTLLRAVTVIVLGFVLSVSAIGTYFLTLPVDYVSVGLFAAMGLVQGATFAAVPQLNTTQQDRALANGAIAQMGNLGNLLGTPVLLAVLNIAGSSGMLLAVSSLFGGGIVVHLLMQRRRTGTVS